MNKDLRIKKEEIIIKRLKKLANLIYENNIFYHQKDDPKITDKEFDDLVKENNYLEKKFPHLILSNSPNKLIGSPALNKFSKIAHKLPMLSLPNAFNQKDVEEFISRI